MPPDIDPGFIESSMKEIDAVRFGEDRTGRVVSRLVRADDPGAEAKRGVISALIGIRDKEALYFIVRALILQLISSALFLIVLLILVTINVYQAIVLGLLLFTASLALSKLLDVQLRGATRTIVSFLDRHERLKAVILRNF